MATASDVVMADEAAASEITEKMSERHKKPVCLIVLGMAGSGKTTFVQRLVSCLHMKKQPPYVVNLDPACREVPYPGNDQFYQDPVR